MLSLFGKENVIFFLIKHKDEEKKTSPHAASKAGIDPMVCCVIRCFAVTVVTTLKSATQSHWHSIVASATCSALSRRNTDDETKWAGPPHTQVSATKPSSGSALFWLIYCKC